MFIETTQNTTSLSQDSKTSFGKRENLRSDVRPSHRPVASTALAFACANMLSAVAVDPGSVPDGDHHCGEV